MKEEERSEREKLEQRAERLEMESEVLKRNNVESLASGIFGDV
jgi:hypothetical protein